jgi:hypothetical protein
MSNSDYDREKQDKEFVEGQKLLFDVCKHLTTLCTGSILILVALLEKLLQNPRWKLLIVVSFGGFILSIIYSVVTMLDISMSLRRSQPRGKLDRVSLTMLGSHSELASLALWSSLSKIWGNNCCSLRRA